MAEIEGQAPATELTPPAGVESTTSTSAAQDVADLPDWAQQQIKNLRSENAERRKKLTAAEGKLSEYSAQRDVDAGDAKTLSETEKLAKERDTLQTRTTTLQERVIAAEIKAEAAKRGGVDAGLIALAVREAVELDDSGEPQNVEALLDALTKDKPFLFGQVGQSGTSTSATNGQRGRESRGQTFSRSQLRDPAFYRANEKDIMTAVREGRITED